MTKPFRFTFPLKFPSLRLKINKLIEISENTYILKKYLNFIKLKYIDSSFLNNNP